MIQIPNRMKLILLLAITLTIPKHPRLGQNQFPNGLPCCLAINADFLIFTSQST